MKEQIEYLRQRKYRPIASMYHYYWSDPCPIMGSGLLDYYRRPYQVYEAMKAVYGRVLISLDRNPDPYIIGREKVYDRGTSFTATVWVTNDFHHELEGAHVSWQIVRTDSDEIASKNGLTMTVPADAACEVDRIDWPIPATVQPGTYRVTMEVLGSDGESLSTNETDITVR